MLEHLLPGKANVPAQQYVPPFLAALVGAAAHGGNLSPAVQSIARHLGFDSFLYAAMAMPEPDRAGRMRVYTTLPRAWVVRYDALAYVEVDPGVNITWDSTAPLVWDQSNVRGRGARSDAFLDDASKHGIASGVCFMLRVPRDFHVFIALNSSLPLNDDLRMPAIARNLPDILMFGHYFHEVFMRSAMSIGSAPVAAFASLSPRERECLDLAAHGMTSGAIASRLEIKARTVQYHFDSIRSKLGAATRQEAVAIAIQSRLVARRAGRPGL